MTGPLCCSLLLPSLEARMSPGKFSTELRSEEGGRGRNLISPRAEWFAARQMTDLVCYVLHSAPLCLSFHVLLAGNDLSGRFF